MSVRARLALTVFATGLVTALLVGAAVAWGYVRLEHETASRRGLAFLDRVGTMYDRVVDLQRQSPPEFERWLRNLVLYEPDTELYLLDLEGRVLARTGAAPLAEGFRVALGPVRESVSRPDMPYVMGDDPERMDRDAVVVARPARATGASGAAVDAGYLYLVIHTRPLSDGRAAALRASFAQPAIGLVLAIIACTTGLALLIIGAVTRPLRALTAAVATLSHRGLDDRLAAGSTPLPALPPVTRDEFGRLTAAFGMLLDVARRQWSELQRLDQFRREGVSNLSHDLRSPLTAAIAGLETVESRDDARPLPARLPAEERRLLGVALRNLRNAARLVRALGDLAKLDEPSYPVQREPVDVGELVDDIAQRFAGRAAAAAITVETAVRREPQVASIDVELVERAVANLVDNALRHAPAGTRVQLDVRRDGAAVVVVVADDGPGVPPEALPHLFERFYQGPSGKGEAGAATPGAAIGAAAAVPAAEAGSGLGLAIVRRIAELHGGSVAADSAPGRGLTVTLRLPASDARDARPAP